jgi:hypothetical protein
MFALLTLDQCQALNLNPLELEGLTQALAHVRENVRTLPKLIKKNLDERKPLCLVKFGELQEPETHPPPDPLLLADNAAAIWSKMTKTRRLLANGENVDIYEDMSEGDCIGEMAFLHARCGYIKPQSWEESADGLGQPNGYHG